MTISSSPPLCAESDLFHLMGFHQRHLRLRRTSIDLDIQDFHLYFIII